LVAMRVCGGRVSRGMRELGRALRAAFAKAAVAEAARGGSPLKRAEEWGSGGGRVWWAVNQP